MCGRYALYLLVIALAGCTTVRVNQGAQPGEARILVARLPDDQAAVPVYAVSPRHRLVVEPIDLDDAPDIRSISLKPGSYVLSVECFRPNASVLVDVDFGFEISVEANTEYLLDCSPRPNPECPGCADDNNFSLLRR